MDEHSADVEVHEHMYYSTGDAGWEAGIGINGTLGSEEAVRANNCDGRSGARSLRSSTVLARVTPRCAGVLPIPGGDQLYQTVRYPVPDRGAPH